MAGQQPAAPAAPEQGQQPPAQPQQGDAMPKAVDDRFAKIETVQAQQGSLLEKIAAAVVPGDGKQQPEGSAGPAGVDPRSLAQQVREEIDAANERRRAEESESTWRAGVNEVVEKVKAEHAPREPEKGVRARLQRALFGKPE